MSSSDAMSTISPTSAVLREESTRISKHPLRETVSFTFSYTTSAQPAGRGEVRVTASDLCMLSGIVWVTAATIQKPFCALWSPGKSTKAAFWGQKQHAVDWPWALFTIVADQQNTFHWSAAESPAITSRGERKGCVLPVFLYLQGPNRLTSSLTFSLI